MEAVLIENPLLPWNHQDGTIVNHDLLAVQQAKASLRAIPIPIYF